jgi:UDPglucose--hexose-1-phosphate uridylyltransferase
VAVAPARASRPGAKSGELDPPSEDELLSCPFCEGREDRTPPEVLVLGAPAGREPNAPGWRVRVVPNLYPAFAGQEVVVHGPEHRRSLAELDDDLLALVAEAWRLRALARREEGLTHLQALVNEGREAGASLAHSHSQLVWLPEDPPFVVAEAGDPCRICALIRQEREEETRVVAERDGLVLLCPWAGRAPYELLIAPVEHERDGFDSTLLAPALSLAAEGLRRLHAVEGPRPANIWLHNGTHWHLELLPRLTVLAGLELGAGVYLNPLPPEQAAASLREGG